MKIPAMIERKFSKYPGPINWNKRVRDERQRAPNEFLKTGFQFFCFFYFFSMTGWQVELGAKDVQGSARLSKCLLNNAVVPKGKKGGKKIRVHSPPLPSPPTTTAGVDLEELSRQRRVRAASSLEGFLSDRSTHTLTAYSTKECMDMYTLTHLHTIFSLRPLRCGIFIGPLGILEPYSGHVWSERMQAYTVDVDDKHTLC